MFQSPIADTPPFFAKCSIKKGPKGADYLRRCQLKVDKEEQSRTADPHGFDKKVPKIRGPHFHTSRGQHPCQSLRGFGPKQSAALFWSSSTLTSLVPLGRNIFFIRKRKERKKKLCLCECLYEVAAADKPFQLFIYQQPKSTSQHKDYSHKFRLLDKIEEVCFVVKFTGSDIKSG